MHVRTGEVKPWVELTPEEVESGDWVPAPAPVHRRRSANTTSSALTPEALHLLRASKRAERRRRRAQRTKARRAA